MSDRNFYLGTDILQSLFGKILSASGNLRLDRCISPHVKAADPEMQNNLLRVNPTGSYYELPRKKPCLHWLTFIPANNKTPSSPGGKLYL
jgi:hypothetical protein